MTETYSNRRRLRRNFGKIPSVTTMPNLIEVQKTSYDKFLQKDVAPDERRVERLEEAFRSVFPIKDFSDLASLEFVRYEFEEPKFDVEECQQRGMTYSAPLKVTLRLIVWDVDEDTELRTVRDIKEQDVYMGDMPLMTENGTFVVNGTERVIVSQMHRSPGVFYDHDKGKTHSSGKFLFAARVIPYRGSWLDFEFDAKDIVHVRIDRRRKLPVTALFRTLGMSTQDILDEFYATVEFTRIKDGWKMPLNADRLRGTKLLHDVRDAKTGKVVIKAGTRASPRLVEKLAKSGVVEQLVEIAEIVGRYAAMDMINEETGEIFIEAGAEITEEDITVIEEAGFQELPTLAIDHIHVGPYIRTTLAADRSTTAEEALIDIYRVMRPGEPPTVETAEKLFYNLFFARAKLVKDRVEARMQPKGSTKAVATLKREMLDDVWILDQEGDFSYVLVHHGKHEEGITGPVWVASDALKNEGSERYDLSTVGRVKMNARLGVQGEDRLRVLRKQDIIKTVKILVDLKDGKGDIDDIDHLGNRRVRSVGELMENQYRVGLLRMERAIRERMSSVDIDTVMPHDLINAKPAAGAVREFFGSSQLSQFMDQTNPLAEITHKRRLSALGPGGLTRERAGFEVRDVHPSHYGRICPIETPEGPNIGLINSLATYAQINPYGFIESPYRKVVDGKVTDEVVYLSAMDEGNYTLAQANAQLDPRGRFIQPFISCRQRGEFVMAPRESVDLMDVSPMQLVSVAAALIPFLENDDANRALMGSNMQRQAVPLLQPEAPYVGTGMEEIVARDSGVTIVARRSGVVDQVDATRIVVRATDKDGATLGVDIYNLLKFQRSNQNTCINQRPLVKVGDEVESGEILADGPSTDRGELALGRNVLVAFMPWQGYNYEDSILISERLVKDDVFTSIHIEEFEVMARDTKLGQEDITRDIPNVSEEALRNLDEAGIVYIGAKVIPSDILVGKITPKGESPMTPEEKLLRAIFGEKASDVRDTSLKVPPGVTGTVVEVRVFSRRGVDKDERSLAIEREEIERLAKDKNDEQAILERNIYNRFKTILIGRVGTRGPKGFGTNVKITEEVLENFTRGQWWQITLKNADIASEVEILKKELDAEHKRLQDRFENKVEKLQRGDELPPGVLKMVKVFVAVKRKLQPGDKMAGRHGNKGVISRIMPIEDMPHLEDGTTVDIVLNPLGVPSRMNVGQILETHLGWAAHGLGLKISRMAEEATTKTTRDALRKTLKEVYGKGSVRGQESVISSLSDDQIIELGRDLAHGVPMATPVFDGAKEADIVELLGQADLDSSGQVTLIDGRTGEVFARKVTVGYIYMLKLHHMVDDKIHARSIGPYSLVTQQPLGGKAQFGGQRFGEMEVWALQAYGAAYTLQEMLTAKSDDVSGRSKVYEAIVRGEENFETGIPESFNVLVKELQALGLNVDRTTQS